MVYYDAEDIIGEAKSLLPDYASELELGTDALSRILFAKLPSSLQQQVLERYRAEVVSGSKTTLAHEVLAQADADFVNIAWSLSRSFVKGWSFDLERRVSM